MTYVFTGGNTMNRNEILFALTGKVEIPEQDTGIKELETALTFNKELSRYGYTLTLDGIFKLATNDKETIKQIADDISAVLDDAVGISDFASSHPFYPDFPEQVMKTDEAELYMNALIYYLFAQTPSKEMTNIANQLREMLVGEATIEREPLEYEKIKDELKPLAPADEKELEKSFYTLIQGPNLSVSQYEYLKAYAAAVPNWQKEIFADNPMTIPSHETLAKVAMINYDQKNLENLKSLLTKSEDVLRFAAVLSGQKDAKRERYMDANLSFGLKHSNKLFKFTRPEQRCIKELLENSPDLYFSIWQRQAMWEKIMQRLDTNDARYPRVKGAFDNLHNKNKVLENGQPIREPADNVLNKIIEEHRNGGEYENERVRAFAEQYPSHFARNIARFAHEGIDIHLLGDLVRETMKDVPSFQKLKLAEFIDKSGDWAYRIATNKKGRSAILPNENRQFSQEAKDVLITALHDSVKENLASPEPTSLKTIYIDEELKNRTLPLRNTRDASKGATLTKYSTIAGKEDKNITAFGIFWKNAGDERADIDLSVNAYTEDGREVGHVYFGNLRESWAVHSGDYTSGMISLEINGAEEFIFADKQRMRDLGIRYLIPQVHGFNRPFNEAESVRFMFMEKNGSLNMVDEIDRGYKMVEQPPMFDGEIVNPSEIELSFRLTQNSNMATPFIYDLKEDKYIWVDLVAPIHGIPTVNNEQGLGKNSIAFYEAFHNDYPDMYTYAKLFAEANQLEVVENIRVADVIVSAPVIDKTALGVPKEAIVVEPSGIYKLIEIQRQLLQAQREAEQAERERLAREEEQRAAEEERRLEEEAEKGPSLLDTVLLTTGAIATASILADAMEKNDLKGFLHVAKVVGPQRDEKDDKEKEDNEPDFHDD